MNIEEFREYCLSLPGTVEKLPFQKFKGAENVLVFYVRGKMYCLIDIDRFDHCTLKCQPEYIGELKASYEGVTAPYNGNPKYWIGIAFGSDVDDELIRKLIENSYSIVNGSGGTFTLGCLGK